MKILDITIERQDGSVSSTTKLAKFSDGFNVLPKSKGVEKSNIAYVMSFICSLSNGTQQHEMLHKQGYKNSTKLLVSVRFSNPDEFTVRWQIEAGQEEKYFLDNKAVELAVLEKLLQQCHIRYIRGEQILDVMWLTPKKRALYFRDVLGEASLRSLVDSESTTLKQQEKEAEEIQKDCHKALGRVEELRSELTTYEEWEKEIQVLEKSHYANVHHKAKEAYISLSGELAALVPKVTVNATSINQIRNKLKKESDAVTEMHIKIEPELDKLKELHKKKKKYADSLETLKPEVLLLKGQLSGNQKSLIEAQDQHTLLHGEVSALSNRIKDLKGEITRKEADIKEIKDSMSRWDLVLAKKLPEEKAKFAIRCFDLGIEDTGFTLDEEGHTAKKMRMDKSKEAYRENVNLLKLEQDLMTVETELKTKSLNLSELQRNIKSTEQDIKKKKSAVFKMEMEIRKLQEACESLTKEIDISSGKVDHMNKIIYLLYERSYDQKLFREYENLLQEEGTLKSEFAVLDVRVEMAKNTMDRLEKEYSWILGRRSTSSSIINREGKDPETALMESKSLRQQGFYKGKKVNTNVIKELDLAKDAASVLKIKHDKLTNELLAVKSMMNERFSKLKKNFNEISVGMLPGCRSYVSGDVFKEGAELDVVEATGSASVFSCCDKQSQILSLALIAGVMKDEATICFIDEPDANFDKKEFTMIRKELALKFPLVQFIVKPEKRSVLSHTVTYSQEETPLSDKPTEDGRHLMN